MRMSFWNITGHPTHISASGYGQDAEVNLGGAGLWLYYVSRVRYNWFLEFNVGAVGGVHSKASSYEVSTVEASTIVPFLIALISLSLMPAVNSWKVLVVNI